MKPVAVYGIEGKGTYYKLYDGEGFYEFMTYNEPDEQPVLIIRLQKIDNDSGKFK